MNPSGQEAQAHFLTMDLCELFCSGLEDTSQQDHPQRRIPRFADDAAPREIQIVELHKEHSNVERSDVPSACASSGLR